MTQISDIPQLALGLSIPGASSFADFWPGPNVEIVTQLQLLLRGDGPASVYLWGPAGSGKTHLLCASCNGASGRSGYLALKDLAHYGPRVLDDLETLDCVCIDDLDEVAGRTDWEQSLFNCCNRLRDAGRKLIVSSAVPLRSLPVAREDLLSRLAWGLVYRLQLPDDPAKRDALRFLCERRGMQAPPAVIEYLLRRMPRTIAELVAVVARLDTAGLQAQRSLSVPFVKTVLKI